MSDGDSGSAANAKTEKTEPGALVAECPLAPTSAIHDRAFGLQKACKRTSERRVARESGLSLGLVSGMMRGERRVSERSVRRLHALLINTPQARRHHYG